jgi:hypothetical protein
MWPSPALKVTATSEKALVQAVADPVEEPMGMQWETKEIIERRS